ncbi:MAG: chemotaxis protein CheV [Candidatus Cloacimonadota bacterium]|nr:MAG: chemotaxis protein CheV [Candidatus Cloacimonadota bacterium]PIE79281.1 MAG: chemotaxis protein CheV [Candidatus Delongbacteria bacterium]
MAKTDILLETGTNELELLEIILDNQSFGINVAKVKEIIIYDDNSRVDLPEAPPSIKGLYSYRGQTFTIIDLNIELEKPIDESNNRRLVVVTEMNSVLVGILVDKVNSIHRYSWNQIDPVDTFMVEGNSSKFTGTVKLNETKLMLLLDLEHISSKLLPETALKEEDIESRPDKEEIRNSKQIIIAEDSHLIRGMMLRLLNKAGYLNIKSFENGQACYDAITEWKEKDLLSQNVDLIVSDIEMPMLDGLTLCKKIKEDNKTKDIPVVIFSSLINEQMIIKCNAVHANGYISKPKIESLVEIIDTQLGYGD